MRTKFGTFHLVERPFQKSEPQVIAEHLEQMRVADELGFDAVWLTEHHFPSVPYVPDVLGEYGISVSPLALACAVSQVTRRVTVKNRYPLLSAWVASRGAAGHPRYVRAGHGGARQGQYPV